MLFRVLFATEPDHIGTPVSEELTPSLKLKRRVIFSKYDDDSEAMYA